MKWGKIMSVFRLSRYEKIFAVKAGVFCVIAIISIILLYEFVMNDSKSAETKKAQLNLSQKLEQSEVPLYYDFKCIGGIPKIQQCNGKYFESLIELLESKNIHPNTSGRFMKQDVSFTLHYYAGPPTKCIENICPKYIYYAQMDIQYNNELLHEFGIKHEYHIEHGKNGVHGNIQLEKIEEIGPLNFKQTETFLKFLSELSEEKQKALVK